MWHDLEKKYTKDQILEFYLNNIYFSNGYYGVGAAARGYFDKEVSELTVAEQVFIAAIPNNPTRYNPLTNYDNTVGRRDLILGKLYENDMINSMNYYTALDTQVVLAQQPEVSKNNSVETYARHCATESMMQANGFVFRTNFNNDDDYEQYKEIYENSYTLFQQKLLSDDTRYTQVSTWMYSRCFRMLLMIILKDIPQKKTECMKCRQQLPVLTIQQEM